MDEQCDICGFLRKPVHQILITDFWSVGMGNNQAYFGRAYVTLRTHKASLSSLTTEEWQDFETIVRRLEPAYQKAFGANPLNWGCFMNNAFREEPGNPHVHWHIFPRYKQAPEFQGITYDDPLYGNFYDDKAQRLVNDEVVDAVIAKLKPYLDV